MTTARLNTPGQLHPSPKARKAPDMTSHGRPVAIAARPSAPPTSIAATRQVITRRRAPRADPQRTSRRSVHHAHRSEPLCPSKAPRTLRRVRGPPPPRTPTASRRSGRRWGRLLRRARSRPVLRLASLRAQDPGVMPQSCERRGHSRQAARGRSTYHRTRGR